MSAGNRIETYRELARRFRQAALHRPMRMDRYEAGTECRYEAVSVADGTAGRVHLVIERFVGGGFAGQVYRVKILSVETEKKTLGKLTPGGFYAMKILIPPSGFSKLFRNALYWAGFQGPFQLQVNPDAARAGALWQKFIRRGARIRFGDESAVADIHATFVDPVLGSCGELSEWIDGRTWRLEVDDHMDLLRKWQRGKNVDPARLGSPEYRAKHAFMHQFVGLLHEMGAHEFARQYEWSTWKSQPNALKRRGGEDAAADGLVAVDFRAGLALLPFLPMSPGDFKLILEGLGRGSLVQFDRGDTDQLERYVAAHPESFADLKPLLAELKTKDRIYRESVCDITHHHVRLLCKPGLWSRILSSAVTGWRVQALIDDDHAKRLRGSRGLSFLWGLVSLIPFLGRAFMKIWGQPSWRRHYRAMLSSWRYFRRAVRGRLIEKIIGWHRAGRMAPERALRTANRLRSCAFHLPLSFLPVQIHRLLTDGAYVREQIYNLLVRPVKLYFNAELREQWLRDMVAEGQQENLLSEEDADVILSQIKEPFIQKYLKSLAVHLCTLPVTQVVSLIVAAGYVLMHPEMPRAQAYAMGVGIIALFQVVPISPGSLTRGLYVVYLVIRERNFKDYNIAVFLGFFKYIGYLAFPIQMAYRYPTLARFMAGHWATGAVHVVPVFGERGALLEHKIYCLFYNWPLTIRRRMRARSRRRASLRPRRWHIGACAITGAALFGFIDYLFVANGSRLPSLREIWYAVIALPLLCGMAATLGAGGASIGRRVAGGAVCGVSVGVLYSAVTALLGAGAGIEAGNIWAQGVWRFFIFGLLSALGVALTEVLLPDSTAK